MMKIVNSETKPKQKNNKKNKDNTLSAKVEYILKERKEKKYIYTLIDSLIKGKTIKINVKINSETEKSYIYGFIENCLYRQLQVETKFYSKFFFIGSLDENLEDIIDEIEHIFYNGNPFGDASTINKVIIEYELTGDIQLDGMTLEDLNSEENKKFINCGLLRNVSQSETIKIFDILLDKLNKKEIKFHG